MRSDQMRSDGWWIHWGMRATVTMLFHLHPSQPSSATIPFTSDSRWLPALTAHLTLSLLLSITVNQRRHDRSSSSTLSQSASLSQSMTEICLGPLPVAG